jgi:hypothetical protein
MHITDGHLIACDLQQVNAAITKKGGKSIKDNRRKIMNDIFR